MLATAVISILVVSVITCYLVAKRRGGNSVFWVVMGLLFGPLAIPFVFFSRPRPPKDRTH